MNLVTHAVEKGKKVFMQRFSRWVALCLLLNYFRAASVAAGGAREAQTGRLKMIDEESSLVCNTVK